MKRLWLLFGLLLFWPLAASAQIVTPGGGTNLIQGSGGGGAATSVGNTAPTTPVIGQLWFNTNDLQTYIWYNDGTSSQWTAIVNLAGTGTGGGGGGSFTAGGDLSGTTTTQTVVGILTKPVPALATGYLYWNGSAFAWQTSAGGSGTVTGITAGTGLTGGTINTSGTIALATPVSVANGGRGSSTAPTPGQIDVAQSGTSFAGVTMSGDATITSTGVITVSKVNGTSGPFLTGAAGSVTDSMLAGAYSGIGTCTAGQFATGLNRNAAPTCAAPTVSGYLPVNNPTYTALLSGPTELLTTVDGTPDLHIGATTTNPPFVLRAYTGGAGGASWAAGADIANGSTWTATLGQAEQMAMSNGQILFRIDTGLTIGSTYTPTNAASMTSAGFNLTLGNYQVNGTNFGGTCPAGQAVTSVSSAVVPACATFAATNNSTLTGSTTASTLNLTGTAPALTFNGVAMGGTCSAGQVVTAVSNAGVPTCAAIPPATGVTDGSNAATGQVGEFQSAATTSLPGAGYTAAGNIASLSLGAGDWEIWGQMTWAANGAGIAMNGMRIAISTTSATFPTGAAANAPGDFNMGYIPTASAGSYVWTFYTGVARINSSTAFTAYLVAGMSSNGNQQGVTFNNAIYARRIR